MRSVRWRASPLDIGVLLVWGLALAACQDDGRVTVVNHTQHELTAVFDSEGRDLLEGRSLPPGTFVRVQLAEVDTGAASGLEAYTSTGACANTRLSRDSSLRWEIHSADLDPGGC